MKIKQQMFMYIIACTWIWFCLLSMIPSLSISYVSSISMRDTRLLVSVSYLYDGTRDKDGNGVADLAERQVPQCVVAALPRRQQGLNIY